MRRGVRADYDERIKQRGWPCCAPPRRPRRGSERERRAESEAAFAEAGAGDAAEHTMA
ncbi:hypothetical protein [Streptosporangium vulgare]|uniref:hypothetical protein n=1 Tax=Streptosporangium vulgare TaxID=46190 RepID=UPI0031D93E1C